MSWVDWQAFCMNNWQNRSRKGRWTASVRLARCHNRDARPDWCDRAPRNPHDRVNSNQFRGRRTHSALASTAKWKTTTTTKLAFILIATGLLAAFLFSDGTHLLSLNELQRRHGQLQDLYRLRPAAVVAAFLAIEICALAVCLPGAFLAGRKPRNIRE